MRLLISALVALLLATPAWATDVGIGAVDGLTKPTVSAITNNTCGSGFAYAIASDGTLTCRLVDLTSDVTGVLGVINGGTNLSASADDNVMVGNGTTWQSKALTTCTGAGKAVTFDAATNTFGCNTIASGTPSLPDQSIQFNQSNAFGGESDFLWDYTNNRLKATNLTVPDTGSDYMALFTGSLPAVRTGGSVAYVIDITAAGSSAQNITVMQALLSGYTGPSSTTVLFGNNASTGTGTDLLLAQTFNGSYAANAGLLGQARATTTGTEIGGTFTADTSTGTNIGGYGRAASAHAGTMIGLLGSAGLSTEATDPKNIAVYGTLSTTLITGLNDSFAGLFDGQVGIWNQAPLRFFESGGNDYVALRAASSVASPITWTLPNTDSTGTQALVSNGSGTLSWGAQSKAFFSGGTGATGIGNGDVRYFAFGHSSTTEAGAQAVIPYAASARNLRCSVEAAPGATETYVYVARKNGAGTALTCTISDAATSCNDTTNSFTFTAGDKTAVEITTSVGSGSTQHYCGYEIDAS